MGYSLDHLNTNKNKVNMENLYGPDGMPLTPLPVAESEVRQAGLKIALYSLRQGASMVFECMDLAFRKSKEAGHENISLDDAIRLIAVLKEITEKNLEKIER
jgi:hypothetical protein